MSIVLNWNYTSSNNELLDYIANTSFNSQSDIANHFKVSVKTIQRRINKLKKDMLLIIHRFQGNNLIYMVGDDVTNGWSKHDAYHIAKYRMHKDKFIGVDEDAQEELMEDLPLFKTEKEELGEDMGWDRDKLRTFNPAPTLEVSDNDAISIDFMINNLS